MAAPSTPSMRKGRDGEKNGIMEDNNGENSGPLTSLPVDHLNGNQLQRRRSWQYYLKQQCFLNNYQLHLPGVPKKTLPKIEVFCMKFEVKISWFLILPEIGCAIFK